jgi:hypothetical protein
MNTSGSFELTDVQHAAPLSLEAISGIGFQRRCLDVLNNKPGAEGEMLWGGVSWIQILNTQGGALFDFKSEEVPKPLELTPLGLF